MEIIDGSIFAFLLSINGSILEKDKHRMMSINRNVNKDLKNYQFSGFTCMQLDRKDEKSDEAK